MNHPFVFRKPWIAGWVVVGLGLLGCKLLQSPALRQPAPTQAPQSSLAVPVTATAAPTALQSSPFPSPAVTPTTGVVRIEPGQLPESNDPALALLPQAQADIAQLPGVAHYRIALQISQDGSSFSGRQAVQVTNQENVALDKLYFRLLPNGGKSYGNGFLKVTRVALDDQPLETALSLEDSVLEIRLPQPLPPGQAVTLQFDFDGQVTYDFGGSATSAGYGIYSLADQVLSLSGWYPILAVYDSDGWNLDPVSGMGDSVYSEMAFYTVQVCAPTGWMVLTTGAATVQDDQTGCVRYESGPARDFFLAASPNFHAVEANVAGVTVRSVYLPDHLAAGNRTLQVAVDSLKVYSQRFGAYPYTELDVVEAPLRYASGVEFPGIVLITEELANDASSSDFPLTTAHEVAHQWWYNLVGNDIFDEPWLDEGLTTYSSSLYYEDTSGPSTARRYISFWRRNWLSLVEANLDDWVTRPLSHFESLRDGDRVYSWVVYSKSAVFLDALRHEIGDQAFFAALQEYYRTYRYRVATTDDLLAIFEKTSGKQLDDFYQKWLYAKGVPQ